ALVALRRSSRDYFEVADSGQAHQDFFLNAISKICVICIVAEIFERQHCDGFRSCFGCHEVLLMPRGLLVYGRTSLRPLRITNFACVKIHERNFAAVFYLTFTELMQIRIPARIWR